ncbi:diamine acetyltransferase 1 [Elysia marginata]|uniref:Diamine acetyltransferase 1 n=1 Tax=Elysia marginata TaxID=1093978 RepID=A0AAV4EPM1_9GAST|nr:diamine acetyltransferase 1 [Elysia marginata]
MATTLDKTSPIVIRTAEPQDCAQVYKLMRELAVHLKCEQDMKLTIEQFYKDVFEDKPVCYCIVATTAGDPSTIVGYSLYFHTYYYLAGFSISMENLYVSQSHRGKGIGKMLWQEVTRRGLEMGSNGTLIFVDNWNKPTKDWYMKHGCVDYTESKDQHYMHFSRKAMEVFIKNGQ